MRRQRGFLGIGAGLGIKLLLGGLLSLGVAGAVFGAYKFVDNLQEENALLKENAAKLEVAVELKAQEASDLKRGFDALAEQYAKLNIEFAQIREERDKRKGVFDEHDFSALLSANPKLVESRMVSATAELFKDFEQASRD